MARAKSAIDFRAVLPERVLGNAGTIPTNLKAATGPTNSLTRRTASLLISSSDLLFAIFQFNIINQQFEKKNKNQYVVGPYL